MNYDAPSAVIDPDSRTAKMVRVAMRRDVPHIAWQRGRPFVLLSGNDSLNIAALRWCFHWDGAR